MLGFLARRVALTVPVLLFVAVLVFAMARLAPGDPAAIIAGDHASPAQVAEIRSQLGLDAPVVTQFGLWLGRSLQGDLGRSYYFNEDVRALIVRRLEPTLSLALVTIVVAVAIAVPLGTLAAYHRGSWFDRLVTGVAVAGFSVPVFVLGYALIFLFAVELRWLPVQGFVSVREGIVPFLERIVLPASALAMVYIALITRMTRASVLEVLGEDHVRTARAKGLSERAVVTEHALRNAAVPIVTTVGAGLSLLVGGVVVTESVFNIPGLGRLTVDAVLARDYPTVQGVVLLFALLNVAINLLVDVAYLILDPRIRY